MVAKTPKEQARDAARQKAVDTLFEKMQAEEAAEKAKAKSKAAPTRSLDGQVQKLLTYHFRSWGPQQTDCVYRSGLSLRQRLKIDKEKFNNGELSMGKNYYQELKTLYADQESAVKRLQVKNQDDPFNEKARFAVKEITGSRVNMKPMLAFLEEGIVDNQRTVVTVLRVAVNMNLEAGPQNTNFVIDVMRWVKRNSVQTRYKEEVEIASEHFDAALAKSFVFLKKNSVSFDEWWTSHKDVVGLVVNLVDWETCRQCKSQWLDVAHTLNAVVTTKLGQAVFGLAHATVKHNRADKVISDMTMRLIALREINKEALAKNKSEFIDEARAADIDPFETFPKKNIIITYRKLRMEVPVNSILEQCTLQVGALVRSIAVETGELEAMYVENELVQKLEAPFSVKVNPEVLMEVRAARSAAAKHLDCCEQITLEEISKVLTQKRLVFTAIDPTFRIEEAFWTHLQGDKGDEVVQDRILNCLPAVAEGADLMASSHKLAVLGRSKVLDFCGKGVAAKFSTIQNWVRNMVGGRSPGLGESCEGPFLEKVRQRLAFFVSAEVVQGGVKETVYGKAAIDVICMELEKKVEANKTMNLQSVRPLLVYDFLLEDGQKVKANKWTDKILAVGSGAGASASSSSGAGAKKPKAEAEKKGTKRKRGEDSHDKVVDNLMS